MNGHLKFYGGSANKSQEEVSSKDKESWQVLILLAMLKAEAESYYR